MKVLNVSWGGILMVLTKLDGFSYAVLLMEMNMGNRLWGSFLRN